jgi:tetratricopeptide (TPR) repeat protein
MAENKKYIAAEADDLLYFAMAEVYASNAGIGDVRIAESSLLKVLKLKTNRKDLTEAHNLMAQLYAQTGRLEKARDHFKEALNNDPGQIVTLTGNLTELLEKQKKWNSAADFYYMGLILIEDAALHQGLSYCLSKMKNLEAAEYHARKACQLKPDNADYVNDLGYTLLEKGNLEEARVYFEQALKINPDHELARNNLTECSQRKLVLPNKTKVKYTPKQGRYLAFIDNYTRLHGRPPAEADMEGYFLVAESSVHQMILTLEKKGLIARTPGAARSIKILLSRDEIPEL